MASVDEALDTQVRNIEKQYGKTMEEWKEIVITSGKEKHGEILAFLKSEYGVTHGNANRIALVVRAADAKSMVQKAEEAGSDPVTEMYAGTKAGLKPIHDALVAIISECGDDVEYAPKKGYVSVRRKKQFAMIQPSSATRLDLGLILKDEATEGKLELSGSFNAMFTHRVRLTSVEEVNAELAAWIRAAYLAAG